MKKFLNLSLAAVLVVGSLVGLTACGGSGEKAAARQSIQIKGSDTMVHLATMWAEDYMQTHDRSGIAVTGGGSGTGIAALMNGTTDIACASRKIKTKEIDKIAEQGKTVVEHIVARDGIAVVVNPNNPVSELSLAQIKDIYTGAVTNWSQVGGEDAKIILLARESSSGTFVFFQEFVLEKADYAIRARRMPATSAMVQSVAEDKNAIGYVGLGYLVKAHGKIKGIKVKADEHSPAIMPAVATVVDGSYLISRPLQLYTGGEPQGLVKVFIDYVKAAEGQAVVAEQGFVPLQ